MKTPKGFKYDEREYEALLKEIKVSVASLKFFFSSMENISTITNEKGE